MEKWKKIEGFGGHYEVSDLGRVRRGLRVLKARAAPNGYINVNLSNGKATRKSVHVLVALSFLGPRPEGCHVAHLDGDQANNSLCNLAYLTPSENARQKRDHGTCRLGERHHKAKLTQSDVVWLRENAVCGSASNGYQAHAKRLGVSVSTVARACRGLSWQNANARAAERIR